MSEIGQIFKQISHFHTMKISFVFVFVCYCSFVLDKFHCVVQADLKLASCLSLLNTEISGVSHYVLLSHLIILLTRIIRAGPVIPISQLYTKGRLCILFRENGALQKLRCFQLIGGLTNIALIR